MMHPHNYERRRALNIERFAAARGWEVASKVATFENESAYLPTPEATVVSLRKATRRWQLALVFSLTVLAPSTAAAVLLALTGGIS